VPVLLKKICNEIFAKITVFKVSYCQKEQELYIKFLKFCDFIWNCPVIISYVHIQMLIQTRVQQIYLITSVTAMKITIMTMLSQNGRQKEHTVPAQLHSDLPVFSDENILSHWSAGRRLT
jgi:hypothetical protein